MRRYANRPIPPSTTTRILDAGRLAGSARNRQPWRFLVFDGPELRDRLADLVYAPANIRGAALVVAIVGSGKGPVGFDCGRAAQNMMLAAWNEGIVSCPNSATDRERAAALLGLGEDETVQIVLSFGYPAKPRDPELRSTEEWSAASNRKPLDEITRSL